MIDGKKYNCRALVWFFMLALLILHQDFFLWDDKTLIFGFLPSGLAYHAWFSMAAAVAWGLAIRHAWPDDVERWAESGDASEEKIDK